MGYKPIVCIYWSQTIEPVLVIVENNNKVTLGMEEKAVERRSGTREFRGSRCQKEKHNSLEDKYV